MICNVVALTRNLTIMTMCLSGVPLHMPAHESSGSHIIRAHGGVLAGRRRQGRKSGGQGRGTGGFEEADPDRDHCGEAGDWRIRIPQAA